MRHSFRRIFHTTASDAIDLNREYLEKIYNDVISRIRDYAAKGLTKAYFDVSEDIVNNNRTLFNAIIRCKIEKAGYQLKVDDSDFYLTLYYDDGSTSFSPCKPGHTRYIVSWGDTKSVV